MIKQLHEYLRNLFIRTDFTLYYLGVMVALLLVFSIMNTSVTLWYIFLGIHLIFLSYVIFILIESYQNLKKVNVKNKPD